MAQRTFYTHNTISSSPVYTILSLRLDKFIVEHRACVLLTRNASFYILRPLLYYQRSVGLLLALKVVLK